MNSNINLHTMSLSDSFDPNSILAGFRPTTPCMNSVLPEAQLGQTPATPDNVSNVTSNSIFEKWAQGAGLHAGSVNKLAESDCADINALTLLTTDEFNSLGLSIGQLARLRHAVQNIKDKTVGPMVRGKNGEQGVKNVPHLDIGTDPISTHTPLSELLGGLSIQHANQDTTPLYLRPEVYLRTSISGDKGKHLDISEYVTRSGLKAEEEEVVAGSGSTRIVIKSGQSKVKLETVTPTQWVGANARIMAELVATGMLKDRGILQYLAYTCKIGDLADRYDWRSVLLFDREYRVAQATHGFLWGTDVPHLLSVSLKEKIFVNNTAHQDKSRAPYPSQSVSHGRQIQPPGGRSRQARNGRFICRLYNRGHCNYVKCRFEHACSVPGCGLNHPEVEHNKIKVDKNDKLDNDHKNE